jgi:hypothetical protein
MSAGYGLNFGRFHPQCEGEFSQRLSSFHQIVLLCSHFNGIVVALAVSERLLTTERQYEPERSNHK